MRVSHANMSVYVFHLAHYIIQTCFMLIFCIFLNKFLKMFWNIPFDYYFHFVILIALVLAKIFEVILFCECRFIIIIFWNTFFNPFKILLSLNSLLFFFFNFGHKHFYSGFLLICIFPKCRFSCFYFKPFCVVLF